MSRRVEAFGLITIKRIRVLVIRDQIFGSSEYEVFMRIQVNSIETPKYLLPWLSI